MVSEQFDKNEFARLLAQAMGDRSLNQYALQSGVAAAHLSRLTRGILESPPTPQTIQKLADHAYNGVCYEDFMVAAGYLPKIAPREMSMIPGRSSMDNPEVGIQAIMAIIETIGDLAAGIQPPPTRALGLGRIKDLLALAADCVGLIGSRTNDPAEAKFTAMVIKAAIDHSQPAGTNDPPGTRR